MTLWIDTRELLHHARLVHLLQQRLGDGHSEVTQMTFGDYAFTAAGDVGTVGIEHATLKDWIGKIRSGRMVVQTVGLIQNYAHPYWIIEGTTMVDEEGRFRIPGAPIQITESRFEALVIAAEAHGVRVKRTGSPPESAALIAQLYTYWRKKDHSTFRPTKLRPMLGLALGEPVEDQILTLMTYPGVGEDRARKALEHFGSLARVMQASHSGRLTLIPGWGPVLAQHFQEHQTALIGEAANV